MSSLPSNSQRMWEDFESGRVQSGLERSRADVQAGAELDATERHLGRGLEATEDWVHEALAEVNDGDRLRAAQVLLPPRRRERLPQLLMLAAALVALVGIGLQWAPWPATEEPGSRFLDSGADQLTEAKLRDGAVDLGAAFPDWAPGDRVELTLCAWTLDGPGEPLEGFDPDQRLRTPTWRPSADELSQLPQASALKLVRTRSTGAFDEPRYILLSR